MGDYAPSRTQPPGESVHDVAPSSNTVVDAEGSAFHSQLEYVAQHQGHSPNINPYVHQQQQPFDMSAIAGALPQPGFHMMNSRNQYVTPDAPGVLSPAAVYQMQQASQYAMNRGSPFDPATAARAQQHQYQASQYGSFPQQGPMPPRQPMPMQAHGQYNQFDPYGYGLNPMHTAQLDPRFASHGPYGMVANMPADPSQFARRASEPAFIPSFPRGPPRKPKQSGHALWVGNLPPNATVTDLKDHFSREATKDIESLFLISKSNCAFVNYRSETACIAAMNRFHDSRFHGVRLVCRLRRGAASGSNPPTPTAADVSETASSSESAADPASPALGEEQNPTIVGSTKPSTNTTQLASTPSPSEASQKVNEKYFIVKSLTVQDLEASVRNGIWATQSHNETVLNRAFDKADNVYLIFSANKSGEYFGYARMASTISGEPVNLSSSSGAEEPPTPGAPQSIPTPATATAPKGRIIDDSARGTIFWEAEQSDKDDEESPVKVTGDDSTGQNWGRQFGIEWISTARLPFYRTRGLRNPWNANREVKIARDGTELEPSVGRRLVQMFHRPSPGQAPPQPGMSYR